jgi:hypothetical protein
MRNNLFFLPFLIIAFLSCSTADKRTEHVNAFNIDTLKQRTIYENIQLIAEKLPMNRKDAIDFFDELDSIMIKTPRYGPSQQFQYKTFTVFYEQPVKGIIRGVGIDLDTSSHVNMALLGKQLGIKWHSADLIEVEAGKVHYSTDYYDSKKVKKAIHITIGLSYQPDEKDNEVTFINIEALEEKKAIKDVN